MNRRQLEKLGIPSHCADIAVRAVQPAASRDRSKAKEIKSTIKLVLESPATFAHDEVWRDLAVALTEAPPAIGEPIEYPTWGGDAIDQGAHEQMAQA